MIELILQAERALAVGMLDQAERLYQQAAELDPRNSIAVVGLARVALDRADDRRALELARKALTIDPENAAAQRLAERLDEVLRYRGEEAPAPTAAQPQAAESERTPEPEPAPAAPEPAPETPEPEVQQPEPPTLEPAPPATAEPEAPTAAEPEQQPPRRRSLLDRLLRRR